MFAPPALALGLSQLASLPDIAALSLNVSTSALAVLDIVAGWRRDRAKLEGNQLFFYYKTGQLLAKS